MKVLFVGLLTTLWCTAVLSASPDAVESSKKEQGLVIYGNVAADNFAPIVAGFRKKYPWIKVQTLDLGPAPAFERYLTESSVGHRSADLIAAASPTVWIRFVRRGELEPYEAAGAKELPDWSPEAALAKAEAEAQTPEARAAALKKRAVRIRKEDAGR